MYLILCKPLYYLTCFPVYEWLTVLCESAGQTVNFLLYWRRPIDGEAVATEGFRKGCLKRLKLLIKVAYCTFNMFEVIRLELIRLIFFSVCLIVLESGCISSCLGKQCYGDMSLLSMKHRFFRKYFLIFWIESVENKR